MKNKKVLRKNQEQKKDEIIERKGRDKEIKKE